MGAQNNKSWSDGLPDDAPFAMVLKCASKKDGIISIDPATLVAARDDIKQVVVRWPHRSLRLLIWKELPWFVHLLV